MSKKKVPMWAAGAGGALVNVYSNAMRKADARVTYRQLYPKAATRWMGHGPGPGGMTRTTAQKSK